MWNSRCGLGVTIAVLYALALIGSIILLIRHGRPRRAWICLGLLSLVRVASGIVLVLNERTEHRMDGLAIAAAALLGVGVYPLLLAVIGLLYIIGSFDFLASSRFRLSLIASRIMVVISAALLVAGACIQSPDGVSLAKAGSALAAVTLAGHIGVQTACWTNWAHLSNTSVVILKSLVPATIFLALRIIYLCLSIFEAQNSSKWNALSGSIGLFIGVALVPEFFCLLTMISVGFFIPPVKSSDLHKDESRHQRLQGKTEV